eukprot:Nitzschia sp. Nitz4//scaffold43_size134323//109082//110221//NITZ4_003317-RA/size134323-processed-gene-0.18-mRNA-1//1//CDS//3329552002//3911//frame0
MKDGNEETIHNMHSGESLMRSLNEPLLEQGLANYLDEEPRSEAEESSSESATVLRSWKGPVCLSLVTLLFSTQNICMRYLYRLSDPPTPATVSAVRGWFSLLFYIPLVLFSRWHQQQEIPPTLSYTSEENISRRVNNKSPLWFVAGELALWNVSTQALFNYGLETTPSARASFLVQTTVVMVPILSACGGESLLVTDGLGSLSSVLGLVVMLATRPPNQEPPEAQPKPFPRNLVKLGDLQILLGALCWSIYLIRISKFAPKYNSVSLQGTKTMFSAGLYSIWCIASNVQSHQSSRPMEHQWGMYALLMYSALGPGMLADLFQQKGQSYLNATESSLILCTEPILTAVLGRLVLGEVLSGSEAMGGVLLILGAVIACIGR